MILKGRLSYLLVNIGPKLYSRYIMLEKLVRVLYMKLQNDLYGLLSNALIFYFKLATDLKNNGFIINIYDLCVANKLVQGKMMTVV